MIREKLLGGRHPHTEKKHRKKNSKTRVLGREFDHFPVFRL